LGILENSPDEKMDKPLHYQRGKNNEPAGIKFFKVRFNHTWWKYRRSTI